MGSLSHSSGKGKSSSSLYRTSSQLETRPFTPPTPAQSSATQAPTTVTGPGEIQAKTEQPGGPGFDLLVLDLFQTGNPPPSAPPSNPTLPPTTPGIQRSDLSEDSDQSKASEPHSDAIVQLQSQVPSIQRALNWTRNDLETGAGTKSFRSTEYKNIVRILHGYNGITNPAFDRIATLKTLIDACIAWMEKNKNETSAKVNARRQVIQRLVRDVNQEIALLQGNGPANGQANNGPGPANQGAPGNANVPAPINPNGPAPINANVLVNAPVNANVPTPINNAASNLYNVIIPANQAPVNPNVPAPSSANIPVNADNPLDFYANIPRSEGAELANGQIDADIVEEVDRLDEEDERELQGEQNNAVPELAQPEGNLVEVPENNQPIEIGAAETQVKKSKKPADKAVRYQERALKLKEAGNLIGAAVQYTRAYNELPSNQAAGLTQYAHEAAVLFDAGGDFERAVLWYRKTIAAHPSSDLAETARQYLRSKNLPEKSKYETSGIAPSAERLYESVKSVYPRDPMSKADQRALKDSGLYKEESASGTANNILDGERNYLEQTIAAQTQLVNATTPEARDSAQKDLAFQIERLEKMALGVSISDLIAEYKLRMDNPYAVTPLMDKIAGFKVKFLNTTAERDAKRLFAEGKIKQGPAPRAPEAENGYDTSNLSSNFAGKGFAIFAMSGDGAIYADQHKVSQFHHSSFLAASETAGSGEIKVESGSLKEVTNKSGHYHPDAFYLTQVLNEFQSGFGQDLSGVGVTFHNKDGKTSWNGKAAGFVEDVKQMKSLGKYPATFGAISLLPNEIQQKVEEIKNPQSLPVANNPQVQVPDLNNDQPNQVIAPDPQSADLRNAEPSQAIVSNNRDVYANNSPTPIDEDHYNNNSQ